MQRKHVVFFMLGLALATQAFADSQKMPMPTVQHSYKGEGSTQDALNTAQQVGTSYLGDKLHSWFSRTDFTYAIQRKNKPVGGVETIQPIWMTDADTVFWQGRIAYSNVSTTANLGLGYRYLSDDKTWMMGVNTFYDENIRYLHKRAGLGAEVFTEYLTLRANYYDALSGRKPTSGNQFERALSGYDASIETPFPGLPWVRFVAEGYHWDGISAKNINGASGSLRTYPTKSMELDLGYSHDNSAGGMSFMKIDYYLGQPVFIEQSATMTFSSKNIISRKLENYRLQKVYRHNDIVVEKTNGASGGVTGITIARGT